MDNTTDNINNAKHSLIEPRKLQGDTTQGNEYNTFGARNDDEKDLLPGGVLGDLDSSDLEKHPPYVYSKIMKETSKYHILASVIYILSMIMFEFLILQLAMMIMIIFSIERIEMITFLGLIFSGIALGWYIKNMLMGDQTLRRNIFMTCNITFAITVLLIITRSSYILFITYPIIAIGCSIILFASKQIYEDYHHNSIHELKNPSRFTKNLLLSYSLIGSFMAFFVMWMCSSKVFALWFIEMLVFSLIILTIGILVYFASDSPISIYRTHRAGGGLFELLESIINGKLDEEKRERVLDELKILTTKSDNHSYSSLFEGENANPTVFFLLITAFTAFIYFSVLLSAPLFTYLNTPLGTPNAMTVYLPKMLTLLIISAFGALVGTLLVRWVNTRKYILIPAFATITTLAILMTIFKGGVYLYAGGILFFGNLTTIILLNYAYESYELYLNEKAARSFTFVYFLGAAVGLILFQSLYGINSTVAFSSIAFISSSVVVLGFFLKN